MAEQEDCTAFRFARRRRRSEGLRQLYEAAAKAPGAARFSTAMDGHFVAKSLPEIALAGQQAKVSERPRVLTSAIPMP